MATNTAVDEQALGFALAGGIALNNTYALAIDTGVLRDKALDNRIFAGLAEYDKLVVGARAAHDLGDAEGYIAKLTAARVLFVQLTALIPMKGT